MSSELVWIAGGLVHDPRAGTARRLDLAVRGDRIEEVAAPSTHPGFETMDVSGLHLLPGLIDCHVHLVMRGEDPHPGSGAARTDLQMAAIAAEHAERTVRAGITTVRDLGGWNHLEMDLRTAIEQGRSVGPRLILAGRLLSASTPAVAYYPGMYEVVEGTEQVRAATARELDLGADVIKVMATGAMLSPEEEDAGASQLGEAEIRAAVEVARARGTHVAAHAHATDGIEHAVLAGAASIEHGTFADERVLRMMADRGVFLVATASAGAQALHDPQVRAAMPEHILARYLAAEDIRVEMLRQAHRLGVRFAMGTDAGTPGNRHGHNAVELELLVREAGLTPQEAVAAATAQAAELLGRSDLGRLETGSMADVVAVALDPRDDLAGLESPALVMAGGRRVLDRG